MTAIALAVVKDGTALAADGRGWEPYQDGRTIRDDLQKIFPFGATGAFALTGWACSPQFSIPAAAARAAKKADLSDFRTTTIKFAVEVNNALALARSEGRFPRFPEHEDQSDPIKRSTVARVFVVIPTAAGAWLAIIRLHHRDQVLRDPIIEEHELRPGAMHLCGSDRVAAWMCGARGERKPLNRESSLQDAVRVVRWYVETCASPAGRSLDPWCLHVGGHVHTTVLTAAAAAEIAAGAFLESIDGIDGTRGATQEDKSQPRISNPAVRKKFLVFGSVHCRSERVQ